MPLAGYKVGVQYYPPPRYSVTIYAFGVCARVFAGLWDIYIRTRVRVRKMSFLWPDQVGPLVFRGGDRVVPQSRPLTSFLSDSWNKVKRERAAGYYPEGSVSKVVNDWHNSSKGREDMANFKRRRLGFGSTRRAVRRRRVNNRYSKPSTFQNDLINIYRKSGRRSKRVTRKARSFRRAVNKVIDSNLGLRTFGLIDNGVFTTSANAQGFQHFVINSTNGDFTKQSGDLNRVYNSLMEGNIVPPGTQYQNKFSLLSTTGQLTLHAKDTNSADTYITLWEIICRQEAPAADVSPTDMFVAGLSLNDQPVVGGNPALPSSLITTPFMSSEFCSHFLIKRSRRLKLAPGEETVLNMMCKKRTMVKFNNVEDTLCLPWLTQGYFVQVYGALDSATGEPQLTTISWQFIRTYNCKNDTESFNAVSDVS